MPPAAAIASLLRLPAVLSAPGDPLLGAATSGTRRSAARTAGLVGCSCCLYLAGMALNDYADRDIDAVERPGRPIPSGQVSPRFALGLGAALSGAGLGLAAAAGGREALRVAVPLTATVWAYDLVLKGTPAGPVAMAAARGLDVLLGADRAGRRAALAPAAVVAAHTLKITLVSTHEVEGADARVGRTALAGTAVVSGAAALTAARRLRRGGRWATAARLAAGGGLLGLYATTSARAERQAAADPSPASLQRAVGAGVLGLVPLEGALHAAAGPLPVTAALAGVWPLARLLARRRAVT